MYKKEDVLTELTNYVRKNLNKGYTKESLRWALVNQGYSRLEVQKTFEKVEKESSQTSMPAKLRPEIEYKAIPIIEEKKGFWQKFFD